MLFLALLPCYRLWRSGARPEPACLYAEDQVSRWEDINWQKQLITVRHEVAKQTSRKMGNRRFIPMEAALLHWLSPYRKEEGLLIPMVDSAVRRRMKKLRLASRYQHGRRRTRVAGILFRNAI